METVIASLISAAAAIIVCLISNRHQHNKVLAALSKSDELQAYRIEQLEKKVDKHNQVIERTAQLERDERVMEERIKVANKRIDDLERHEENWNHG